MKTRYPLSALLVTFGISASAQLANWSPGPSATLSDFPQQASPQINGSCRISQFRFHPTDPNKIYAVTSQGGFFTTTDGGNNWVVKSGMESNVSSCASLCIDRTNDQVIYLGTGDPDYYTNGQGLLKSTDGGATFLPTTLTDCLVDDIYQHPVTATTFVASTNKGIYKSTDNCATWTATTATTIEFCDMQRNAATNSLILYAATLENTSRLFRSTDFGSTWSHITSGLVTAVANVQTGGRVGVTPANPNVVYFGAIGGLGIVHKSTDGGLNFTVQKAEGAPNLTGYEIVVEDGPGQGNYNNAITVDRNDATKLWYTSHCVWKSSNSGVNWTFLHGWAEGIHTDAKEIFQSPFDATKLWASNDGGMWLSTDEGVTWTTKSNGLYAYEVGEETTASNHTYRDELIIGTQDNGKIRRNATVFTTVQGGDDYAKKSYDYLPSGGYIYNLNENTRSPSPGNNGDAITYGLPPAVTSVEQTGFNRVNPELGFICKNNVYRTTNLSAATPTWTQISTFSAPIKAVHSCIANTNRLYVITDDGNIRVSSNALSGSPTFVTHALPTGSNTIASIAAMANNANTVYISVNDWVYVSYDGGATWTDISYNLPAVNHRRILAEEYGGTQELVFVATNNAVYYKKAGQVTWTNYSTNLPGRRAPTGFTLFDDGTNNALIRFSTFGRGVWETPFDNLRVNLNGLKVAAKVFLEGPFNSGTGLMNDALRGLGTFPTTDPYPALGYVHTGGGNGGVVAPAVIAVTGSNAIVDWVVLELRNPAAGGTVMASRSALVQRDGDIVELDGTSPVVFALAPGSYFVAVRHRNHTGCMVSTAVALSASPSVVNFTNNATTTYGTNARKTVGAVEVLWAGDVTFNHQIKYTGGANDRDPILVHVGSTTPNNVTTGYDGTDVNLDGTTKYTGSTNDRDPILVNVGSTTPNNVRVEQLP